METNNTRPTTASIDRRVERLEIAQSETDRKVDALGSKLSFLEEFMKLQFDGLRVGLSAQQTEFKAFVNRIDALILEGTKQSGDLSSTPAGRQIVKALETLQAGREENRKSIDALKGRVQYYAGGLAVLAALASIFGGTIARAIGLPQP